MTEFITTILNAVSQLSMSKIMLVILVIMGVYLSGCYSMILLMKHEYKKLIKENQHLLIKEMERLLSKVASTSGANDSDTDVLRRNAQIDSTLYDIQSAIVLLKDELANMHKED